MHASRNISLCSKDCLCLFVCPTGATDTETGQIDFNKCLDGCRLCVDVCPSHAISLVPDTYAPPQKKSERVKASLLALTASKIAQEKIAAAIAEETDSLIVQQFARAFEKSNRIMAEDCLRESGFMLPQSQEVKDLLKSLLNGSQQENFPRATVEELLRLL